LAQDLGQMARRDLAADEVVFIRGVIIGEFI
jgi:hypothetical protein